MYKTISLSKLVQLPDKKNKYIFETKLSYFFVKAVENFAKFLFYTLRV
jgi:hypothetical protein